MKTTRMTWERRTKFFRVVFMDDDVQMQVLNNNVNGSHEMFSHVGDVVSPEYEVSKLMLMNSETLSETWVTAEKVHIAWCTSLVV